jgi:hypothetical protein
VSVRTASLQPDRAGRPARSSASICAVADLVGSERKGLAYGWYNVAIDIATLPSWG